MAASAPSTTTASRCTVTDCIRTNTVSRLRSTCLGSDWRQPIPWQEPTMESKTLPEDLRCWSCGASSTFSNILDSSNTIYTWANYIIAACPQCKCTLWHRIAPFQKNNNRDHRNSLVSRPPNSVGSVLDQFLREIVVPNCCMVEAMNQRQDRPSRWRGRITTAIGAC